MLPPSSARGRPPSPVADLATVVALPNPTDVDAVGHEAMEAAGVAGVAVIVGAKGGIGGVGVGGGSGSDSNGHLLPVGSGALRQDLMIKF